MGAVKEPPGVPTSPEQAADLAALQNMIEPTATDPQAPAEPAAPSYETEAAGLVDMLAALICGYEPKCAPVWTDERKGMIVAAAAPVMEKYNFSLGSIPPEITLMIVAGPPLYQCSKIIAEGMKPKEPKRADAGDRKADSIAIPDKDPPPATQHTTASREMMELNI